MLLSSQFKLVGLIKIACHSVLVYFFLAGLISIQILNYIYLFIYFDFNLLWFEKKIIYFFQCHSLCCQVGGVDVSAEFSAGNTDFLTSVHW